MPGSLDINPQFQKALDLFERTNKHVFLTGKAGTGKSTLLNHFRLSTKKNHVVLAPTGIAAVNIDGETIHSFFGFSPNINPHEAKKEARERKDAKIFTKLDMMVIDEISMVRADLMDSMDIFLKTIRRNELPFGGVQVICIGDLFQLPPVLTNDEREMFGMLYDTPYFFSSNVMKAIEQDLYNPMEFIELTKIYRQKDLEFVDLLNKIRNKQIEPGLMDKINSRYDRDFLTKENYIYLVATNKQADEVNTFHLDQLKGEAQEFWGEVKGEFDAKGFPTDQDLILKVGARVMFVKNDPDDRWINGTLGTVTHMSEEFEDPEVEVQIDNGPLVKVEPVTWTNYRSSFDQETKSIAREEIGSFNQMPLRLAWAITIHKSQGKTFDNVVIDFGRGAFAHGQVYVAMSRCRSFEGMVLKNPIQPRDIILDTRVGNFYRKLSGDGEELQTKDDIVLFLRNAIENEKDIHITYAATNGTSERDIRPARLEQMEYNGHYFMGLEAYCHTTHGQRIFSLDKILGASELSSRR